MGDEYIIKNLSGFLNLKILQKMDYQVTNSNATYKSTETSKK